jgi:hypothetical protein
MAGKAGALVVRFVGDTRDLSKSTVRVHKTLGGLSKVGKGMAIGIAAAGAAVGAVATQAAKDLIRVERLGKQTDAVIKATGGAAGRSRKQLDAMSEKLEKMSGAEAEAVTEGQNMLLTFKNIKGKQFDAATKAVLDMGVAMNKGSLEGLDLQKTSIQVGKALNDPIKGVTALSKVGVSFTEKQREQIKAMVEAGDVAGAQKVILKELKGEFGGAAKAAGQSTEGMWAKIQNTFGAIAESTFSFLLPVMMSVMTWVQDKVLPVLQRFGDWLKNDGAAHLKTFGGFLKDNVLPRLMDLAGFLKDRVLPPVMDFGRFLAKNAVPALQRMGEWIAKNRDWLAAVGVVVGVVAGGIFGFLKVLALWRAATAAVAAVQAVLNAVLSANPVGLVILAVAALVAGLVFFFTKTKTGQKIVQAAWSGIQSAISGVTNWWTKTAWPNIKRGVSALGDAFRSFGRWVAQVWRAVSDAIGRAWNWVNKNVIIPFKIGLQVLGLAFRLAKQRISDTFWNLVRAVGKAGTWVRKTVFGKIGDALNALKRGFRNARDNITNFWNGLKRAAAKPVNFLITWVWNKGLRKVLNAIPGVNLPTVKPIKLAGGGRVDGPGTGTSDSVPARLSKGEHVWTAREVRAVGGQQVMYGMRKAALAGQLEFAKGGELSASAISRAQAFARRQAGKPYGWGAVGPSRYDCSGFMSALTNVLRGQSAHRRVGSTASFPWAGFEKGPGQFTIGSSKSFSGGIGHMAGNLAGLGVESRGGRGVIVGQGAMAPSRFKQVYHLGAGGDYGSGGGWVSTISDVLSAMRKLPGQIREMMSHGGWMVGFLKKLAAGLWSNLATWLNKKIPDIGPIKTNPIPTKFAHGGFVKRRPGGVHAIIGEGRYDEVVAQVRPGGSSGGGQVAYVSLGNELDDFIVKAVRRRVRSGGGNVQIVLGRGQG